MTTAIFFRKGKKSDMPNVVQYEVEAGIRTADGNEAETAFNGAAMAKDVPAEPETATNLITFEADVGKEFGAVIKIDLGVKNR
ncbi:hypothetical protein HDU67_009729 [Dinochytrium kinnereticum]|nr:hypothetical protein HDU67_009729 [Dinochytrium kinnereticum]